MNVVEKYLEKYNQCIILLSGFEQLHLTEYAKNLAENLNFELVKFDHENYNILNNEVNKYAKKGVVAYGLSFEKDKLNFKTTYHISLSGPKTIINDDNKYQTYTDNIKNSFINKFKNIKDLNYHDEIYEDIFNICIDIIMKRVYGDRYEEVQKEYAKLTEKEKFDTPKKSEDEEQKEPDESEVSVGGKRSKKNKRIVIGSRILMHRIKL